LSFFAALRFLTSIPLPWLRETSPKEVGHATGYFPIIGLIIGLVLAGLNWLLSLVLPSAVVNVLLLASLVVITGAIHLDGFIDSCDGIAGDKTPQERWQVMHDSRAGSFGIIGAILLLLAKYAALGSIPGYLMTVTLLFMPVVSRWAMVYAIFTHPYARPSGLGKIFKQGTRWPAFTIATLITLILAIALIPLFQLGSLIIVLLTWIITAIMAAYFSSKFAGLTGDTYGAINEVAEVSVLIIVVLLARFGLV